MSESQAKVRVRVKTRLKKFDGEIRPGDLPVEIQEGKEREVDFDDLSPEMQNEVRKLWE